jgi:hypothetical protein
MKKSVFEMSVHRQLAKTKWKFKGPLIEECAKSIAASRRNAEPYAYHFGQGEKQYLKYDVSLDVGVCQIEDPTDGIRYSVKFANDYDRMFYESGTVVYISQAPFTTAGLKDGIEFEDVSPITKKSINRVALAFRAMAAHIVDNLCASFEIGVKLYEKEVDPSALNAPDPNTVNPAPPTLSSVMPVEEEPEPNDDPDYYGDDDESESDDDDSDDDEPSDEQSSDT